VKSHRVDREKWAALTIFEQLGNIYSEVGRSLKAKQAGDQERAEQAMFRAIDLFDATVEALLASGSPRVKEVLRAKEQYLDAMTDREPAALDLEGLDRYFMQFAIAARLRR